MAYAQLERGILRERVRAGMDRAKRQGKHVGRPGGTVAEGFGQRAAGVLPRVRAGELSVTQAAAALGTSRATVYRLLAAIEGRSQDAAPGA